MKTIEEAANEICVYVDNSCEAKTVAYESFVSGVEFAQQFYIIERDQYAEIDLEQKEELELNMPILVKYLDEYGDISYDVFAEYYPTLEDPIYTHWRPINKKTF